MQNKRDKQNARASRKKNKSEKLYISSFEQYIGRFFFFFLRTYIYTKIKVKITGKENLNHGYKNVFIVANHQSHLDTPILLSCFSFKQRQRISIAAAHDHFFKSRSKARIRFLRILYGIFPFYRKSGVHKNIMNIEILVERNRSILLFPEGSRSKNGEMGTFKAGIGMLVHRFKIPVIPIKLTGLHELLPPDSRIIKSGKASVSIGKPMIFSEEQSYEEISKILEDTIRALD